MWNNLNKKNQKKIGKTNLKSLALSFCVPEAISRKINPLSTPTEARRSSLSAPELPRDQLGDIAKTFGRSRLTMVIAIEEGNTTNGGDDDGGVKSNRWQEALAEERNASHGEGRA